MEYSIVIFDKDGHWIRPYHLVDINVAVNMFAAFADSYPAKIGAFHRIIVTDGGDFTIAEWLYAQGITWPPTQANDAS